MDGKGKPVPDWQLERLALGELDEATAREIQRRLATEGEGAGLPQRLAGLEASSQEILARLPPATVAASIRRRLEEARARAGRRRLLISVLPLAMAGAGWLAVVSFSGRGDRDQHAIESSDDVTRVKGATRLLAYRASDGRGRSPARLEDAARVRPHDLVQLAYTAGSGRFGAILSVDGRGVVTQHLPVGGGSGASAPLEVAGEVRLPSSYELDDAPGFERFFLVTSASSFPLSDVLSAARALARDPGSARRRPLALSPGLSQESLTLEKVQP